MYISNKWFSFFICNPLKTWWKAKKYFKRPKISINFFSDIFYNCPYMNITSAAKILDIWSSDVTWKDKYNSPRHERNPFIWVCFFRKFGFSINWNIYYYNDLNEREDGSMFYWEYLLDFVYYKKTLKHFPTWIAQSKLYKTYNSEKKTYDPVYVPVPVIRFSLNKEGIKKLKELL